MTYQLMKKHTSSHKKKNSEKQPASACAMCFVSCSYKLFTATREGGGNIDDVHSDTTFDDWMLDGMTMLKQNKGTLFSIDS